MPYKGEGTLRRSNVFTIVITYGELGVWALFVAIIDNTDVTAAKYRTFLTIVGYRELC